MASTFLRSTTTATALSAGENSSVVVLAPAGTLTAEVYGYNNGPAATAQANYATIRLTPLYWATPVPTASTAQVELPLPDTVSVYDSAAYSPATLSSTYQPFVGGPTVSITNPHPTKNLRVLVMAAGQMTVGTGLTYALGCDSTGATVSGSPVRGEEGVQGANGATGQLISRRYVDLAPGTTTFRMGGRLISGSGAQNCSYNLIQVTPVGYVGVVAPAVLGLYDTGWVIGDTGWVASTGWAITTGYCGYRRIGDMCFIRGQVNRTGATITVPANGDVGNVALIDTMPAPCTPAQTQGGIGTFTNGRQASYYVDAAGPGATGRVALAACAPGANIIATDQMSFAGCFAVNG
jgi:hypothetical protein